MWENMVQPNRPQTTIWCMRLAAWITKATDTHWEYVILIALPGQKCYANAPKCYVYTYTACLYVA